jgi:hypothetical protein
MKLDRKIFRGVMGNRRDNLVRYIDRILNFSTIYGIGELGLGSMKTIAPRNDFVLREITYKIPDFNIRELER